MSIYSLSMPRLKEIETSISEGWDERSEPNPEQRKGEARLAEILKAQLC